MTQPKVPVYAAQWPAAALRRVLGLLPWQHRPPAGWRIVLLFLWAGRGPEAAVRCRDLLAANPKRADLEARLAALLLGTGSDGTG
ncbi:MAG TPA: hypothetical protein VD902_04770, partial [Symbiobacteriaceae bacterium]|nr:hypothetical protein [Symbiobacteriaceae bacterium]